MQALVGEPLIVTLPSPSGIATGLGMRVEESITRAVVVPWAPAVLADGVWTLELVAPSEAGEYLAVWRTDDGEPPSYEAFEPLTVLLDWRPTVADVAEVSPAYTRPAVDAAGESAGAPLRVFDDRTNPTAATVEGLITTAVTEVAGRVGAPITAYTAQLARTTAKWHAAAAIEAERAPEGVDETASAYRWKQASYVACLNELISQARRGALVIS